MPAKRHEIDTHVPIIPPEDENFLVRWSRRKRQVADDVEHDPAGRPSSERYEQPGGATSNDVPEPALPPLESLAPDSDLSGFMSPKVSAELRRQALRRVFSSAKFNVCDGLDDYAEDFHEVEVIAGTAVHELRERLAKQQRDEVRAEVPTQSEGHDGGEHDAPKVTAVERLNEDAEAESDSDERTNA